MRDIMDILDNITHEKEKLSKKYSYQKFSKNISSWLVL